MFLDDADVRTTLALGLRLVATERVPAGDDAFERYVHELADRAAAVFRAQGVRATPPFPGTTLPQPPSSGGERRIVFVADLWREDELVGTAITALIRGRIANISVAPPRDPPAKR